MIKKPTKWETIVPFLVAVMLVVLSVQAWQKPIGDFGNYYYAATFLTHGNWGIWIYEPITFNQAIYELGQRNFFLNYTPVPPFTTLIYSPLVVFDVSTAKVIWNLLNIVLFLVALYRLRSISNLGWNWLLLFVTALFIPLRNNMYEGQSYLLLVFLVVEGFYHYRKDSLWVMAICWALAIHLKLTPAIFLFFLLFEKGWKPILYLLVVVVIMFFCSLPLIGTDVWLHYLTTILPRLFAGEINNTYATNYQSAQVLFKQLFYQDTLHNPSASFHSPYTYLLCWNIFKYVIISMSVYVSIWGSTSVLQRFSVWLTVSFLISGYGNSFSLILLIVPISLVLLDTNKQKQILLVATLVIIGWLTYGYFESWPIVFHFPRLFALLVFLVLIVQWNHLKKAVSMVAVALAFAVLTSRTPEQTTAEYVFNNEVALLCYDYKLLDAKHLSVFYFDDKGPQSKVVELPFEMSSITYPEYSAQQLGAKENVRRVAIINGNREMYLSDFNRGVGFYTLRIISKK